MRLSTFKPASIWRPLRYGALMVFLVVALTSCGEEQPETTADQPVTRRAPDTASSTPRVIEPAVWTRTMREWPDTVRWTLDSNFTHMADDLRFRLRMDVSQDISEIRFQEEQPLIPEILMIVRPVSQWRFAQGLKLDSVSFYDPVKERYLPAQPMLSWQRVYEDATVRTEFLPNLAETHRISPDLEEGQRLKPTVFFTWDKRTFIVETPPLTLKFVRDPDIGPEQPEPPPDYRSGGA